MAKVDVPHRRGRAMICPYCGYHADSVSLLQCSGDVPMPEDGDVSLCLKCGEWCVFNAEGQLRKPTDDEFLEIGLDKDCMAARIAWVRAKAGSKQWVR